jgi:2-dehydro-3-deoxyphosphogluconate aldolase/(4S)-4-hydroxy-2-oxoglutarate aldolase
MPSAEPLERLREAKVVAVLRADAPEVAVSASIALAEAGVRSVELTFTTPGAAEALREARERLPPDVLVGAGTIRTAEQLQASVEAGADFLVTPHLDPAPLDEMLATGLLTIPGVFTPSEVGVALNAGAEVVKLFPAATGGLAHLKALRGPFPELQVVATGGIGAAGVRSWLDAGRGGGRRWQRDVPIGGGAHRRLGRRPRRGDQVPCRGGPVRRRDQPMR